MHQRVSIVEGKKPVIVVAPYGPDDANTDDLANTLAKRHLNCYAVVNWGWERDAKVNCLADKADCNDVQQCHEDVVFDEFLSPILRFKKKVVEKHGEALVLIVTGQAGNSLPDNVDAVLGYGQGSPPSFSCEEWKARIFGFLASEEGVQVHGAKPATALSGHKAKSLNQLFVRWYPDRRVESLTLDVCAEFLRSHADVELLAEFLTKVVERYRHFFDNWSGPIGKFPDLPTL